MNAIGASVTPFSRIGMSIYGKALDPLEFSLLSNTLEQSGYPTWAAPEFAPLNRDDTSWQTALSNTMENNTAPAKLIDIYNETNILNTPAVPAIKEMLLKNPLLSDCQISETQNLTPNFSVNPQKITWKRLSEQDDSKLLSILLWKKNSFPKQEVNNITEFKLSSLKQTSFKLPILEQGFYF